MSIVSFVILHYKDIDTTDLCVQSILRMEHRERIRIVIVDNDVQDTDEERQHIEIKYKDEPAVSIIHIKENGGFSYANNQGYYYAKYIQKADFILVLNNDIEFTQIDFINRLDEVYKQYPCHVLGPDVVRSSTGEHQNPLDVRPRTEDEALYTKRMHEKMFQYYSIVYPLLYWKSRWDEERKLKEKEKNINFYSSVQKDIVPFGACLIYTPLFVKQEDKAFEPETRFYYEEYILACRCKKAGYKVIYNPSLKVLHESGVATQKSFVNEKKRMRFTMERIADAVDVYLDYIKDIKI